MDKIDWYTIKNESEIISPSLLVYPDRIRKNIELMIEIAGGTDKLRPHIKTHKMVEIVKLQQEYGIQKFKCATIAEAELLGMCNAEDVLLAMQPVEIDVYRFFDLIEKYPKSKFSTIVDNRFTVKEFSKIGKLKGVRVSLWMDINNGMNRTGILPYGEAKDLFEFMSDCQTIIAEGFHVYDGHIRNKNFKERKEICDKDFQPVLDLKENLEKKGIKVKGIVAGGTGTFPIHKDREGVVASPGTPLLWDAGYGGIFSDLKFVPAAILLTRIISKPNLKLACFDLGHKSVASEMSFPRVFF